MAILTALFLASTIRFEVFNDSPTVDAPYTLVTLLATPVWLILFKLYGLYEPRQVLGPVNEFKQVFHGVVAGTVLIIIADSTFRLDLARGWPLLVLATGLICV